MFLPAAGSHDSCKGAQGFQSWPTLLAETLSQLLVVIAAAAAAAAAAAVKGQLPVAQPLRLQEVHEQVQV